MRPMPAALVLVIDNVIFGALVGLTIYAAEGSAGFAVVAAIGAAVVGATIDEDRRTHREPDDDPLPGWRDVLRDGFWPPTIANALRQVEGRRRLGAIVFHYLAPPLILLPFALGGVASGEDVRAWVGAVLVILVAVRLMALAVALVIRRPKGRASTASPPEPPGACAHGGESP